VIIKVQSLVVVQKRCQHSFVSMLQTNDSVAKICARTITSSSLRVHYSAVFNQFYFLASADSSSIDGCLLHFRSLYNAKIANSVPYVATTNYNIKSRCLHTSIKTQRSRFITLC